MKSAFGSKRKARKIHVDEEEDGVENEAGSQAKSLKPPDEIDAAAARPTVSQSGPKAFKQSSLRQSITFDNQEENISYQKKPTRGSSNSTLSKNKRASSRLSFGPGEIISGDAAEALEDEEAFTPKKSGLSRKVIESSALRKSLPIPTREREEENEERPTYSRDYLNELKSSTPSTPKDLHSLEANVQDDDLDAFELEGATIVDTNTGPSYIPSEAEIREKKERRARLAHEKDFISLNDHEGDGSQLSLLHKKKKSESRLIREEEDIGEGFDEFVEDGRISLGKKQEREAKRRHRKEMADMIQQAEGSEDDEEDDSEAERKAAYEAAQTRAGMDGLHKPESYPESAASQLPPRIAPLPVFSECLAKLQNTLATMEMEMQKRHKKMADLKQEKKEILAREEEVQKLLKEAGNRYATLKADSNGVAAGPLNIAQTHGLGASDSAVADRGLESFGNTPTMRHEVEDVG